MFKADIKHYFESIDHGILLEKIRKKIKDERVLWLIKTIIKNHKAEVPGKGLPLGNLTSQFFANFYLDEFDHFVKEDLKAEHYLRYVDDFVVLHRNPNVLRGWEFRIEEFLDKKLQIKLHPEKSKIIPLRNGITLLGFRLFAKYRLLKKNNARRIWKRLNKLKQKYDGRKITREAVVRSLEGWLAYAEFANSYKFRKKVMAKFNELFAI